MMNELLINFWVGLKAVAAIVVTTFAVICMVISLTPAAWATGALPLCWFGVVLWLFVIVVGTGYMVRHG